MANGRGQSFIGASPERLVRVSKGVLETEALAGSIRRGASASEDAALAATLLRSEKDRREHEHVVAAIGGRLAQLGLKPEFAAQPGLRRLANVQHLHTPVRAALPDNVRLLTALAALHPTPAVGGAPMAAAVAAAANPPPGRSVQLGGLVSVGSVRKFSDGRVEFTVRDQKSSALVRYQGDLPDLFREGQGIVATGSFAQDGHFEARQVLAKHDERYMPKQITKALKAQGEWRGDGAVAAYDRAGPSQ